MTASSKPTRTTTQGTSTICRPKTTPWIRTCPRGKRQQGTTWEETTIATRGMAALNLPRRHREVDIHIPALMAALMDTTITITLTVTLTHTRTRTPILTHTLETSTTITATDTRNQHPRPSHPHRPAALGPDHRGLARPT